MDSGFADPDLRRLAGEVWDLIEEPVRDRASPFRTPVLASLGRDGWPRSRTVIVRDAERAARRVTAFTDARSAKAAELAADPRAALTWYAAERQIQLRGWARARLHAGDARTRACWEALPPVLRAVYGGAPGPGAPIGAAGSGRPAFDGPPSAEAVEPGYAHFVVLDLTLERIEWLRLRPEGNLSARFVWDGDGGPAATWIVP